MQIFGRGFIAKNLKKIKIQKKYIIYAAGVSNSNLKEKKKYNYEISRFKKFLKKMSKNKTIIYISTFSANNKDLKNDLYVKNKIIIENLIKRNSISFIIFRLPQIIGISKNKNTLTNAIYYFISREKKFSIWKGSVRNLIDIDDLKSIIENYLKNNPPENTIINIYNPKFIKIEDLIKIFEKILNKKAKVETQVKKNKNVNIKLLNKKNNLDKGYYKDLLSKNYYKNIIKKYYS